MKYIVDIFITIWDKLPTDTFTNLPNNAIVIEYGLNGNKEWHFTCITGSEVVQKRYLSWRRYQMETFSA